MSAEMETPGIVPAAQIRHNVDQSTAGSDANNILAMNTEDYDTDGMHDLVTNNSRITIHTPGIYVCTLSIEWDVSAVGTREVQIRKNNGLGSQTGLATDRRVAAATGNTDHAIACAALLAAGDYLEARVKQTSGGALNVRGIGASPRLTVTYVGAPPS